jgi:hypothetical protein
MPENELKTPVQMGPWPDMAAARLFLSQMVNGQKFSNNLPDIVQLADWLNHTELGSFAYTYVKHWDEPATRMVAERLEITYWAGVAAAGIKLTALEQILRRFAAEGIDCTLIKGVAFGFTIYTEHAVRPMNDMDLWIQKKDLPAVCRIFKEMGYQDDGEWPDPGNIPGYVSEFSFYPDDPKQSKWNVEVHWELLPRPGLIGRLPLEDWWQRRRRVTFQGRQVMVLDPADALVLACTHQILQHGNQIRLRWVLDIDRLIRGCGTYFISPPLWQRLEAEFCDSEIWPVIHTGIQLAVRWFATPLSDQIHEMFSKPLSVDQRLFYLFYAVPHVTVGKRMITNLRETNSFRYRVEMTFKFLFPQPKYMMERYKVSSWILLPFYYAGRIFMGMLSFLRG